MVMVKLIQRLVIIHWAFDGQAADLNKDWAALPQCNVARLQSCIVHSARIAAVHSDCRDAI